MIILKGKKWRRIWRMRKMKRQERWKYFSRIWFENSFILSKTKDRSLYYKRKFSVCNLTVLNVGVNKVGCYMWDEAVGNTCSVKVASYVFDFCQRSANGKKVILFSDIQSGQNRTTCTVFLDAVRTVNIPTVNQWFFEPGQIEVNSLHPIIEKWLMCLTLWVGTLVHMISTKHIVTDDGTSYLQWIPSANDKEQEGWCKWGSRKLAVIPQRLPLPYIFLGIHTV
jgi:hypothetical protein